MRLTALLALVSVGVGGASPAVGGASPAAPIPIDGRGASLRFDGHGGLSAGASSRLLRDYAEPYRSQVLDFLFKPSFGAALQINKVEIGGDTQSTDGTEASFRHYREEPPQCGAARGYEMWLLQEGHARNPDIESYLLSWGVPAWVGNGSYFSAENIEYQVQYAACVRANLGGDNPHYIGIWNERSWGTVDYVVSLRSALDAAGLAATKIVLPDGGDCAQVAAAAEANATFAAAVYALGEHYPCRRSCPALAATGLAFWASEDYSTVADWAGAGCWGRSLSQNFVLLNATSTIAWSTIWSVYTDESYFGNGLMYAFSPWSGNYTVNPSIWTSAHWTQFIQIGDRLLLAPSSGTLPGGGSFVASRAPDGSRFTLVLETLKGACLRCTAPGGAAQDLVFALAGGLPAPGAALKVWLTTEAAPFVAQPDAVVAADGTLAVSIPADAMMTISTVATATHGAFAGVPPDAPFPLPYADAFAEADYAYDVLPRYFGDQGGSFAVRHGVLQQVVPADPGPNGWVRNVPPYTLLGDGAWTDVAVSARVAFSNATADRGDAAPPLAARAALGDAPAAVAPCAATAVPAQAWEFNKVAPGYLSLKGDAGTCLNVPGCDAAMPLIYYACVTTGCECGCPAFTNLQFALDAATGALTTPMDGECVTLRADGALALAPCARAPGQVWALNATSGQLAVAPPGGGAPRCLQAAAAPPPPPPGAVFAGVSLRATRSANAAYTLRLTDAGAWEVAAGARLLGSGPLPAPFNSSEWHALRLAAKGTALTAAVDGVVVFSGADAAFAAGQVALSSGYHYAAFDDFGVDGV